METVYVLYTDIVGSTLLPHEEKVRCERELREAIEASPAYRNALAAGTLVIADTGDGMSLAFFDAPTAPLRCALEVAQSIVSPERLPLRMGIHSGPAQRGENLLGKPKIIGEGIETAQRVMDSGRGAGHIRLSRKIAEELLTDERWLSCLHDLGEVRVKHGVRLPIFGYYDGTIGQPPVPELEMLEAPTGAIPPGAKFYIPRPTDTGFQQAIAQKEGIILVLGARQMGKTSLLARGMEQARERGAKVVSTDLQSLPQQSFASLDSFYLALAKRLAHRLGLKVDWQWAWDPDNDPNFNMELFLVNEVLGAFSEPFVWALDEVDRLFTCPFSSEVFGQFRVWYNNRANDPDRPWGRLTLALACAVEAHLFIPDLNQSPFNVGRRLALQDFTPDQVAELNSLYGSPLKTSEELNRFNELLNGQPYLVRQGMHIMVTEGQSFATLEASADAEDGPYGSHLRQLVRSLNQEPELKQVVRDILNGRPCPTEMSFYRLRSAGVLTGGGSRTARIRCQLYARYLSRYLR